LQPWLTLESNKMLKLFSVGTFSFNVGIFIALQGLDFKARSQSYGRELVTTPAL
jgi:hypothetical protein